MKHSSRIEQQYGVGLIEVMVTILLLSTSLLALGALQSRSLQFNQEAYLRSQANIAAYAIIDRVRVNFDNFQNYDLALSEDAPTGSSRVETDLRVWRQTIARSLPGGLGGIDCDATSRICTVTVSWAETSTADTSDPDEASVVTFTYQTRV